MKVEAKNPINKWQESIYSLVKKDNESTQIHKNSREDVLILINKSFNMPTDLMLYSKMKKENIINQVASKDDKVAWIFIKTGK